ncbi:transmembrane protein, putative (macronuclear) [Tetrahymena thermophila SB210]|uniref:Transmembrane protein, putative n=1 Tax=Tetrahymena thermophila (strain SB210) TaxID=312017 RepID=Q22P62_TETTS|nr:transmembrane protein, putative [Tetrahymena thermophila SB210]EAR86949.2 transmembrane protein, putative [Tetrahymena thermophila SB210]|eukprot:XP_001007194.2 transmembrane protein, putative [Tetrahymena thermophila SB210]
MYTKVKGDKKALLSILFIVLCIGIAFASGVIFSYMADNGCSKVFIVVACFSFFYFGANLLLFISPRAWEREANVFWLFLFLGVLVVSLVGLGYSIAQSACDLTICGRDFQNHADDFWSYFNGNSKKKNFEDRVCGNTSDDYITGMVVAAMGTYEQTCTGTTFYMKRGWPISFTVLQSLVSLIQFILTFTNLYTCGGCKPKPVNKGVSY